MKVVKQVKANLQNLQINLRIDCINDDTNDDYITLLDMSFDVSCPFNVADKM